VLHPCADKKYTLWRVVATTPDALTVLVAVKESVVVVVVAVVEVIISTKSIVCVVLVKVSVLTATCKNHRFRR